MKSYEFITEGFGVSLDRAMANAKEASYSNPNNTYVLQSIDRPDEHIFTDEYSFFHSKEAILKNYKVVGSYNSNGVWRKR